MTIYKRNDRQAFCFSGPDAGKLLNDVLTGEFKPEPGAAHWWALLSPQGKIQAEGLAGWQDDAYWLDLHESVADAFFKRMRLYRMRAKVEITDLKDSHAVGWSATKSGGIVHEDSRAGGLGFRIIAPRGEVADWQDGTQAEEMRIAAGVPELGPDFGPDSHFPHDLAMDMLGGIDFDKGCYVGQEVVSRMKHRGTARRRPVIVSGDALEAHGEIKVGTRSAGETGAVASGKAVAILRLDRIDETQAATQNGHGVSLALPAWASYRFGDSGGS